MLGAFEFAAGHSAQVGSDQFILFHTRGDDEYDLESEGELYVVEFATQAEMNA